MLIVDFCIKTGITKAQLGGAFGKNRSTVQYWSGHHATIREDGDEVVIETKGGGVYRCRRNDMIGMHRLSDG